MLNPETREGITEGGLKVDEYIVSPPWNPSPQNPAIGMSSDLKNVVYFMKVPGTCYYLANAIPHSLAIMSTRTRSKWASMMSFLKVSLNSKVLQ